MRRGDIWTAWGSKSYAVCAFTTEETELPLFRLPARPNLRNPLSRPAV